MKVNNKLLSIILCAMLLICALFTLTGCGGDTQGGQEASDTTENTEDNGQTDDTDNEDDNKDTVMGNYENTVKVMSYNIYYKDVDSRSDNIQDLIIKNSPDVLMLQEVSTDWITYLQEFMGNNDYSYYGYGRYGGEFSDADLQSGDQFVLILWKTDKYELVDSGHFWLSSTPDIYSSAWTDGTTSNYPRCVNWVILKDKDTGGELFALNIHTDPEDEMVRNNSSALAVEMAQELSGGRPVVMGGDWNMGITDTAYSIVADAYLDIRFNAVTTTTEGSFNNWGEREEGNYAFGDHLFMSDNMAAELYEVVDDYYDGEHISDHCPIQAILYY